MVICIPDLPEFRFLHLAVQSDPMQTELSSSPGDAPATILESLQNGLSFGLLQARACPFGRLLFFCRKGTGSGAVRDSTDDRREIRRSNQIFPQRKEATYAFRISF